MSIVVVGSVALDTVETPRAHRVEILGGAAAYFATAASLYTQVNLVGIVGRDFPREHLDFWRRRRVDLQGLQIKAGSTLRWSARYHTDMNARDTMETRPGMYADFHPRLPRAYRTSKLLYLARSEPRVQREVLEQVEGAQLRVLDTMDLWIATARPQLTDVIRCVDVLLMSEEELRQYTHRTSLADGARHLLDMGLEYVVVKQGRLGARLFGAGGTDCSVPGYPLEEVVDPTGAGSAFAGGFLGYLSHIQLQPGQRYDERSIKRALVHGNIVASYACEDFSIDRLRTLSIENIVLRYQSLVATSHFDTSSRIPALHDYKKDRSQSFRKHERRHEHIAHRRPQRSLPRRTR
jgi:sugar/nucleoside kinase (ribokinase family)